MSAASLSPRPDERSEGHKLLDRLLIISLAKTHEAGRIIADRIDELERQCDRATALSEENVRLQREIDDLKKGNAVGDQFCRTLFDTLQRMGGWSVSNDMDYEDEILCGLEIAEQCLTTQRQWSEQAREAMAALRDSKMGDNPEPIIAKMEALLAAHPGPPQKPKP